MIIRKPYITAMDYLTAMDVKTAARQAAAILYSRYIKTPWFASLSVSLGLMLMVSSWQTPQGYAALSPSGGSALPTSFISLQNGASTFKPLLVDLRLEDQVLPNVLTQDDIQHYKAADEAQRAADWKRADKALGKVKNRILMGHLLAKRYLSKSYKSSASELASWLKHYSDHPQAGSIYQLALAKKPALKSELPAIEHKASLRGYGDDNGLTSMGNDTPYSGTWHAGLKAWKDGHYEKAAKMFTSVASHQDTLSPWMASAAAYWSYRANSELGNHMQARHYLRMAAENPRSFYGIIACKQLHRPLDLQVNPVRLTESDVLEMIGDPAVRRTIALAQVGMDDLADKELRAHFPMLDREEKPRLLALAHSLNLPSIQVTLASRMRSNEQSLDFARYPIPDWQPEGGFTIDPALIYALMRQESGFRISAVSPGGALGLMQLMPQTASLMQKRVEANGISFHPHASVTEPVMNITLGQNYLQHLMDIKLVEGNLFYLLAAYNAGPGRLQEWKRELEYNDDPLLFVESIPYAQTRNYVMQVMTNYWIYSELTGKANYSVHALLQGHWPWYQAYSGGQMAKRDSDNSAG